MKNLILLELNEINFEAVNLYIKKGENLKGFSKIFEKGVIETEAESEYKNLEPWIQWPSVHTGKKFNEHKVFRLGDFVNSDDEQIFEKIENAGFVVGAISPMNASNNLKNPAYFIPDPWTSTSSDGSFFSKSIANAITQAVNDNSESKLTVKTIMNIGIAFIALVNPARYIPMVKYAASSFGKPWRKALFLDMLLYEFHKTFIKKKQPNFSTLFLNAGAHIQHHYFFNSIFVNSSELENPSWYIQKDEDPFLEMLKVYNAMLLDLQKDKSNELIVATGLSQKPYKKLKFYYRLKDHVAFLKKINIKFKCVKPRMTRDFLVSFNSIEEALEAERLLSKIYVNNKDRLFGEIDNRGKDIFVVLTYPNEINNNTKISILNEEIALAGWVNFVAIKNGEHQSKGFAYFSDGLRNFAPPQNSHVSMIYNSILNFFDIQQH